MQQVVVVGAGAMGQLFGARLALAGTDVVLVDTAQVTIDALNDTGITLVVDGRSESTPVRAGRAADFTGERDLVIVFTKGFHTSAAVESVAHLTGPRTVGLTLQNGLGNGEVLARRFGPGSTWIGTTDFPADLRRPGLVQTSADGEVRFGTYTGRDDARTGQLADMLTRAGLPAAVEEDIDAVVWEKVAFNAALNTLSAVTGYTVGGIGASAECRGLVTEVIDEVVAVATSHQVDVSRSRIESAIGNAFAHHRGHRPSMLQDREAGQTLESDHIGGAVVERGRAAGVPTPVLRTLTTLLSQPRPTA